MRSNFGEFTADGWVTVLCSVAIDQVERYPPGPAPAFLSWYVGQLRAGSIVRVRSLDDLPPEAIGEIEYHRRSGIHSSLGIPLRVSGRTVGLINFSAFRRRAGLAGRPRCATKDHWRSNGPSACAQTLRGGASAAQSTLARITRLTTMHEVTASIAHEVNQPLSAIVANGNAALRWLRRTPPEVAEATENINQIIADSDEQVGTIQGDVQQENKGAKVFLDVNEVIEEVVRETIHGELNSRQVLVGADLSQNLSTDFSGPRKMQQVILNLVINAAEAMTAVSDGSRVLNVSSRVRQPEEVIIAFEDRGPRARS